VIDRATIRIQLSDVEEGNDSARILTLPWTRPSPYRKREIIEGSGNAEMNVRPMPAHTRAILIEALRDAHRWLDELLSDPRLTLESIASREDKSERSIRMTLSLAFLAPEIVKAAVEGLMPRGFGLKRLEVPPGSRQSPGAAVSSTSAVRVFSADDEPGRVEVRVTKRQSRRAGQRVRVIFTHMVMGVALLPAMFATNVSRNSCAMLAALAFGPRRTDNPGAKTAATSVTR
jgi:hypothetical protein